MKNKQSSIRLIAILIIAIVVILTGALLAYQSFVSGELMGGILGLVIAIIIILFAVMVYKRGTSDLKKGLPIKDERSRKVVEKASSMAFFVTLYMLLAVGFLSDNIINFRDVSQATSIAVGLMALLFAVFWFIYNRKAL